MGQQPPADTLPIEARGAGLERRLVPPV